MVADSATAYFRTLHRHCGTAKLGTGVLLMLSCAALEGVGLMLLVPMLGVLSDAPPTAFSWLFHFGIRPTLAQLLAVFVVLVALRALLTRQRDLLLLKLRLGFLDSLRQQLHEALAKADWKFLSRMQHGEVMHVLLSDLTRVNQGTYFLMQGMASLGLGGASLVAALSISVPLTLVTLLMAGVLSFAMRRQVREAMKLGVHLSEANRSFFTITNDFLGGLKLIKANGAEAQHVEAFASSSQALNQRQLDFMRGQGNTRSLFEIGAALLLAALVFTAAGLGMSTVALLPLILIFARLLPMVKEWNSQAQQFMHMLPAFKDAVRWLHRAERAAEPHAANVNRIQLRETLTLHHVTYRHRRDGRAILDDVSLELRARTTTAIIGPSGTGKTTLADLVLGLLVADSGTITIDGKMLTADSMAAWRQSVGYVPQEPFLFPGTVRENLLKFAPDCSEEEMWTALDTAAAGDFVRQLPEELDTFVGERGIRLSGGEKQRITLARALLTKPQLLVLDEATSHLDPENEQRIQQAMARLHGTLTVIVIAHRLNTIRHADKVFTLESGHLRESPLATEA